LGGRLYTFQVIGTCRSHHVCWASARYVFALCLL